MGEEMRQDETPAPLTEWQCYAKDVIFIKFVSTRADIEDDSKSFHPVYTHQIFKDEIINGYQGLKVDVLYSLSGKHYYISVKFTQKNTSNVDDIYSLIEGDSATPGSRINSLDEFVKLAEAEVNNFTPAGTQIASYVQENQQETVSYEVYKSVVTEKIQDYVDRIQLFALWFIDGASKIDSTDPSWEIYITYEKREKGGEKRYQLVGYCTAYKFFSYPEHIRKRISQFLILPLYQKKGHGRRLLQAIYDNSQTSTVKDITVEDPNVDFMHLRTTTDMLNLQKHGFFTEKPLKPLDKETIDAIRDKLKLHQEQIKRCYEIAQLALVNRTDEAEYKPYRLAVKRRLHAKYADILDDAKEKEKKKQELDSIYKETEAEYLAVLQSLQKGK